MWALNEVEGLVKKAARGAGFPVGQSEDLGRIAAYLAGTGASVEPITRALCETPTKADIVWGDGIIEIRAGAAALIGPVVRDAFVMGCKEAVLADVTHAPLVAAFLAENGVAQKWEGARVTLSDTTVLKPGCMPVTIPQEDWQLWQDLAGKTYVPETQASRIAGAGAGLTDND